MKSSTRSGRRRTTRTEPARRVGLLADFDRSGLSAAAFARQRGLNYTTFCGWCQRRAKIKAPPAFVQVELPALAAPAELVIELGAGARMRLQSAGQLALAVELIQTLNAKTSC